MNKESGDLFRGILLAHLILFLHLLIVAGLGLVVIFFYGISQYLFWIFLGATAVLLVSGIFFYRYMITRGKQTLRDIQDSAVLKKRSFEVRFLGGLASFKLGRPESSTPIENTNSERHHPRHQLEDPDTMRIRELIGLADMLEKNLITLQEYSRVKRRILDPLQFKN